MTEDSRAPGGTPSRDERAREQEVTDRGQDRLLVSGPPNDGFASPDPGAGQSWSSGQAAGVTSTNGFGDGALQDRPRASSQTRFDQQAPYGAPQGPPPPQGPPQPMGAPPTRPAFTPHDYEPPRPSIAPYGGWGNQRQAPPNNGGYPAPPIVQHGPNGPGGPAMPNWAVSPQFPGQERRRQNVGPVILIAVIVALVAGGLGGAIGVLATKNSDSSSIDLGGGKSLSGSTNRPPNSIAGIARRVVPSVVMIKVTLPDGTGGEGSGIIVNGGYILTNNHVVADAASGGTMQVVFANQKTSTATIIGRDPNSDIAVIKPNNVGTLPALQLGNSDDLAVGDPVIAVGSPLGLSGTVTTGIVSALNRPVTTGTTGAPSYMNAIQTDAAINPGNSGGPLVDMQGRVIGVDSAIATLGNQSLGGSSGQSGSIGLGFAIPINQASRVAEQLIKSGKATHPVIGATIDLQYQGGGARLATVGASKGQPPITAGGPADKAGLKPGDIITSFDGTPITGANDLIVAIRAKAPGDKVQVTYKRGSQVKTVVLTLGEGS
jgi:putative serine protease PepD